MQNSTKFVLHSESPLSSILRISWVYSSTNCVCHHLHHISYFTGCIYVCIKTLNGLHFKYLQKCTVHVYCSESEEK